MSGVLEAQQASGGTIGVPLSLGGLVGGGARVSLGGGKPTASTALSSEPPQDMEKELEALQAWKELVAQELDRVVAFWTAHSHDPEHGCATHPSPAL